MPARVVDATGAAGGPVQRGRARPRTRPGHNGRVTDPSTDKPSRAARSRMTGRERREQLIGISRKHFADKGFEGATVEEIAAWAGVSKPVVYEHFGGKEGSTPSSSTARSRASWPPCRACSPPAAAPRGDHRAGRVALLGYVETSTDGFRISCAMRPAGQATGSFASLMSDIASQVEHILAAGLHHKLDSKAASCTPRCSSG